MKHETLHAQRGTISACGLAGIALFAVSACGQIPVAQKVAARAAAAQPSGGNLSKLRVHEQALGPWSTDAPGVRRRITVADLPLPYATPSVDNGPQQVPRPDGALPKVPAGFSVQLVMNELNNPRALAVAPNGDIFVAESGHNSIRVVRVKPGTNTVQSSTEFATGLRQPFGIAFYPNGPHPRYVYVGNTGSVVRFPYANGDTVARGPAEMIVPDVPSGGHLRGGGHWTRDLAFSRDNKWLYVSVGSHSNNSNDAAEYHRADILRYTPEGRDFRIYASGIRNPVGIAVDPSTGVLWTSVNERDTLGDQLVPDYITHVRDGGFYGWPWFFIGNHVDPRYKNNVPHMNMPVDVPDVLLQSHSASLQLAFYTGKQFPQAYRGGIFAAEHGSWNRSQRTGYKVTFVPMRGGKAVGEYDDFMTGFVTSDGGVWGRPVGVVVGADGSLFVTDDGSHSLWRVAYSHH